MGVGETIMVPEEWLIELQVISYIDYLSERIFRDKTDKGCNLWSRSRYFNGPFPMGNCCCSHP